MKTVFLMTTILFGGSHGPVVEVPMEDWNTCMDAVEQVEWYMPMEQEEGVEIYHRTTCVIKENPESI